MRVLTFTLLLCSCASTRPYSYEPGYSVEFEICAPSGRFPWESARLGLVDPGDGAIQSSRFYLPLLQKRDGYDYYRNSTLVHSGGKHYIYVEPERNYVLAWGFRVGRVRKEAGWSNWLPHNVEIKSPYSTAILLDGADQGVDVISEIPVVVRYRVINYFSGYDAAVEPPACIGGSG